MNSYTVGTAYTYGVAFLARLGKAEWEQRDSPINSTKRGSHPCFPLQCCFPAQVSCQVGESLPRKGCPPALADAVDNEET